MLTVDITFYCPIRARVKCYLLVRQILIHDMGSILVLQEVFGSFLFSSVRVLHIYHAYRDAVEFLFSTLYIYINMLKYNNLAE